LVLSRVRLIRVRLVLVNLNPINDTYIPEGCLRKIGSKIAKNCDFTGKMVILRGFFQHVPHKIETFSIDEIRTLLRVASSTSHAVSDFEVLFLTHCRFLPVWA